MEFGTNKKATCILLAAAMAFGVILVTGQPAEAAGRGQVIVELQQETSGSSTSAGAFYDTPIEGTDGESKQEYKFQRQRRGRSFTYVVANLAPNTNYQVELSFVEHEHSSKGKRLFNAYIQGSRVLGKLDIFSQAGKDHAFQRTYSRSSDSDGRMAIRFRSDQSGCRGDATVSTIRIYRRASNLVEIDASESRHDNSAPVRHSNGANQNTFETVLGRLGSRLSLNLVPQRLGARFSSLGDGTGDLEDLVMAMDDGGTRRCLPFTDRYPVWESMKQSQTMTSQRYACSSGRTPFSVEVTFRAPFYPGMDKLSGAPFVYIDVKVKNRGAAPASGEFIVARPHRREFAEASPSEFSTATETGMTSTTRYPYNDESTSASGYRSATEALAVPAGEAADVDFRGSEQADFEDFSSDDLWGYRSPAGYPKTYSDYKSPTYSYYPRGYSGAVWSINDLGAGDSVERHFVLAGFVGANVLSVRNSKYADNFRFRYRSRFANVRDVVKYAVTSRWAGDRIEERSDFFDRTISSDTYLALPGDYRGDVRDLICYSFQSFLMNTWWCRSDSGRDWFSVWEGSSCRFHSTVDVTYNDAWFYLSFWPDLLKTTIEEWGLYLKRSRSFGTYLSHDMGWGTYCGGQAYPHDMAVEENANYVLLLYKYWRATGDTAFMRSRWSLVKKLVDFLVNCDTNNNGLPDEFTWNTLDQSAPGIQHSRDQSYLGVKCLAAFQAAGVMAENQVTPDAAFRDKCRGRVELIDQTLSYDLWLSDHYAVCLDGSVEPEDREAYSIYATNGLLYLLNTGCPEGVTSGNIDRMKEDVVNSASKTLKKYGCTHSTFDSHNQWVSQNVWRDMTACYLGVDVLGENPLAMSRRYWDLQRYFATKMNGSFYDVVVYPGGGGGLSGGSAAPPGSPFGGGARYGLSGGVSPGVAGGGDGYLQSLGYYPRGAVSLGLLEAVAGLSLDVPGNTLYYKQTTHPLRVPVFAAADWSKADPSKRVPVLYFSSAGKPKVTNGNLLPSNVTARNIKNITGLDGGAHAISPNSDGVNDIATVRYDLPVAGKVKASIWEGEELENSYAAEGRPAGRGSFTWDGTSVDGSVVIDGIHTARIDARASSSAEIRPAAVPVYVNRTVPDLAREWYLAEGYTGRNETGGEFEQYVLIQNPGNSTANTVVTFMMPGGDTSRHTYEVAPRSRFTITVDDILPDAEVSTHVSSDVSIAVERAMYFNDRRAGHASIGVSSPSKTWYLAEGYTAEDFDEYVLVQNPGDEDAKVRVDFMVENGQNKTRTYTVGAHSRFTIHVDDIIPDKSISTRVESSHPVVVERAQYLNDMKSGTCSIGAVSPSRTWFLAEGYTDQGFEEWVLLQNPTSEYNEVTVTFMERTGANTIRSYLLAPESRYTIPVDDILPASEVSVKVRSEHPLLVERAMYWNERSDGHACIGTPTPDTEWYLAEGYTDQGFETWVLVQNPGDEFCDVTFTFMEPGGKNTVLKYLVAPRSRFTVGVDEILPASEVSTRVSSDHPIIVERAMYFNERSGGTDSIGIRGYSR
jgi:hypothetical protein